MRNEVRQAFIDARAFTRFPGPGFLVRRPARVAEPTPREALRDLIAAGAER